MLRRKRILQAEALSDFVDNLDTLNSHLHLARKDVESNLTRLNV